MFTQNSIVAKCFRSLRVSRRHVGDSGGIGLWESNKVQPKTQSNAPNGVPQSPAEKAETLREQNTIFREVVSNYTPLFRL